MIIPEPERYPKFFINFTDLDRKVINIPDVRIGKVSVSSPWMVQQHFSKMKWKIPVIWGECGLHDSDISTKAAVHSFM